MFRPAAAPRGEGVTNSLMQIKGRRPERGYVSRGHLAPSGPSERRRDVNTNAEVGLGPGRVVCAVMGV